MQKSIKYRHYIAPISPLVTPECDAVWNVSDTDNSVF